MTTVFINYPLETFTPTGSGALATIIWECCRVAERQSISPWVVTRESEADRFPHPNTIALEYPKLPAHRLGIKILRAERKVTGWRHLRHKAYAVRVARALRQNRLTDSNLVLMNDPEMAIYLRRLFPKARILHWFFNHMESSPRVRRSLAKSADVFAGVSNFTSNWIADYYKLEKVNTIYIGVDADQFRPGLKDTPDLPIIGFLGRTGIEKAPDLLLQAALNLTETTRSFGIQLIGSNHWDRFEMDDYQRHLQTLTERLQESGIRVERTGHIGRAKLPDVLRKADIHVVPSRWDEPFALTTLEGMASGLAVIASRTGGTPEAVDSAGLLFERDAVDELAEHLRHLVCDRELRDRFRTKARRRAEEFTWDRTWSQLLKLVAS